MTAADPAERTRIRAAESRIEFNVAGAFTVMIAGTLAYVHYLFEPIVPPLRLWLWTGMFAAPMLQMVAMPLIIALRRPDDAEIMRVWARLGYVAAVLLDTAVAASVWMLLPYASEELRLLMVVFYAAAVSAQVISTAESLGTVTYGIVTILGSAALFFLMTPSLYSVGLAVFLVVFGVLMIGVAVTLKIAIRSAIAARLKAEAAAAELAIALAAATDARNAKTRFIAAATHDLRQPLQAAALFFNLVAARVPAGVGPAIANTRMAFNEAAGLLDRLLDHLRLDSGMIEARVEPVALAGPLARLCEEVSELAGVSGLALRCVPSGAHVTADPHLLGRVLRNLLHNALRHSRGTRILVGVRRHGRRVRIYVIDNGRGIAAAEAGSLFDEGAPPGDRQPAQHGAGIGLTSSRRMAELMGGNVVLDPKWRHGAAFYCELASAAAG